LLEPHHSRPVRCNRSELHIFRTIADQQPGGGQSLISQTCQHLLPSALLALLVLSAPHSTGSAVEQLQNLQAQLRRSHANNDWHLNLAAATEQQALLNGAPDALIEVARAQLHLGENDRAFDALERVAEMGQSVDLLEVSRDFSALVDHPRWEKLQNAFAANRSPLSLATTAFPLSDPALLAEDVDYDPGTNRFFITSVREKKIIATIQGGASIDFAKAPDNWPMLAIKVDSARSVVWATEVAMQGFSFAPRSDWGRSAVLCFDLGNGRLLRRIEGPQGSALGDMALASNGEVIVSDGDGGGLYRASQTGSQLTRLDNGDFISPQTPAIDPDGRHIFVPDYVRGIAQLELATKKVRWLPMENKFALNGIDGLYFDRGKLIAVQNGTSPERVVVFTLDGGRSKITSEKIIERSTPALDPTHGVIVDGDFFFIANSGWDAIDDQGNMKPGAKLSLPRLRHVRP
jgi:sugar lactone lactonase YvrE